MQDMKYYTDKLMQMPALFNALYEHGEYVKAAYVYRKAAIIAAFLELPQQQMSELFGYWPDDGNEDTVPPEGLFIVERVRKVNWQCCVRQHKTYQDEACRQQGEPQKFYSDEEYCALKCQHASFQRAQQVAEIKQ